MFVGDVVLCFPGIESWQLAPGDGSIVLLLHQVYSKLLEFEDYYNVVT